MNELIERVAKAVWENQRTRLSNQDGINARLSWRDNSTVGLDPFWQSYVDDSRAAIAAMREFLADKYVMDWPAIIDEALK